MANQVDKSPRTVSVIMATRFRSHYIGGALDSLCRQSMMPDELVIVDNGPCEKTRKVVETYQDRLPIKYVIEETPGVANARNKGINLSFGDYILFIDDDCFADKYWIENIVTLLDENPDVGCVGGDLYPIMPENPSIVDEFCCEVFAKGEDPIDLSKIK